MSDLLTALASKRRLNREALGDKIRLVLAEKEIAQAKLETKLETAQAEKEIAQAEKKAAQAEKKAAQAELEATILRLQAKNMEALRLANCVNLRGAIGKSIGWGQS